MKSAYLLTAIALAAVAAVAGQAARAADHGVSARYRADWGTLPHAMMRPRTSGNYDNWAGYGDLAHPKVQLYDVAARFTVPTVSCPGPTYEADFWVGLDGWNNGTVEQDGVDAYCNIHLPSGGWAPTYTDWYEMYPDGPVTVHTVSRGDTIIASVSFNSTNGKYYLEVDDRTHPGGNFSKAEPCPRRHTCDKTSAEIVVEDPGNGPAKGDYLARYAAAHFSEAEVISRNGTIGSLGSNAQWTTAETVMKYGRTVMSQPSRRTGKNTAFTVTFRNSG